MLRCFITVFTLFTLLNLLIAAPRPVIVIDQKALPTVYVDKIVIDQKDLTSVLEQDLERSGCFLVTHNSKDADFTTVVHSKEGEFRGYVLDKEHTSIANAVVTASFPLNGRATIHRFADEMVREIRGEPGFASTQVTYISTQTGSKEVYIMDIDGANARQLTSDKVISLNPKFSPGGKQIAYTSYKSNYPDVWVIDLESKKRKRVAFYPGLNAHPAFSPDGAEIALTLSKDGNTELYVLNADGSQARRMTHTRGTEASPSWSPDGSQIAYVSDDRGAAQIYLISSDGGEPTRLKTATSGTPYVTEPAWSPTIEKIAYSTRINGQSQIAMTNLNTSETTILTTEGGCETPAWTRNARHLVYSRGGRLYLLDSLTRKSTPISTQTQKNSEPHCSLY